MTRSHSFAPLLALSLMLGCAGPAPTTMTVPAATGGTVINADYQLVIPPMSLATDTEVTLMTAPLSGFPALENARPEVLLLEPEGTMLTRPASITIVADFVDAGASDNVAIHQLDRVDGVRWVPLESTRMPSGDVSVSVTRFAPLAVVVTSSAGGGGVRGVIRWGDGTVVSAAPVQLFMGTTMVGMTTTDAAGVYTFQSLAAGNYRVVVDYECRLDRPVTVAASVATLDLILCGG